MLKPGNCESEVLPLGNAVQPSGTNIRSVRQVVGIAKVYRPPQLHPPGRDVGFGFGLYFMGLK
jgi:hypothetical protein